MLPPKRLPHACLGLYDAMMAGDTFLLPDFDDHLWEPVRVMAGIAMGLKCPVCATED